jgi:hypothetical protein
MQKGGADVLDIQAALGLTDTQSLLEAAMDAEARNCEPSIIRELWRLYYEALASENAAERGQ